MDEANFEALSGYESTYYVGDEWNGGVYHASLQNAFPVIDLTHY